MGYHRRNSRVRYAQAKAVYNLNRHEIPACFSRILDLLNQTLLLCVTLHPSTTLLLGTGTLQYALTAREDFRMIRGCHCRTLAISIPVADSSNFGPGNTEVSTIGIERCLLSLGQ